MRKFCSFTFSRKREKKSDIPSAHIHNTCLCSVEVNKQNEFRKGDFVQGETSFTGAHHRILESA